MFINCLSNLSVLRKNNQSSDELRLENKKLLDLIQNSLKTPENKLKA